MVERDDFRISCTAVTGQELTTAYAEENEYFYGVFCAVGEPKELDKGSVDEDEIACSDNEVSQIQDSVDGLKLGIQIHMKWG